MIINKIAISVLVIMSLFTVPTMKTVESKDTVTLASGTENEFVVPADADTTIESNISTDFVQEETNSLNFEKVNLEGLSGNLNTGISDVYAKSDGTFVVLITITNDSSSLATELYAHSFLLIVDLNGVVKKSMNISTGEEGVGTSAIKRPEEIGGMSAKIAAAYPTLSVEGNDVYVSYTGYTPSSEVYTNQYYSTDLNLTSSSWSTASTFDGATSSFAYSHNIYGYSQSENYFKKTSEFLLRSNYPNNASNKVAFEHAISNPVNKTQSETKTFEIRTPEQMVENIPGATVTTSGFRGFDDILMLSNGNMIGTVYVTYRDSAGNAVRAREICVWDSDNNLISYHSATHGNKRVIQYGISNENELYFSDLAADAMYLKKLNISTGVVEDVKKFPAGTNITIKLSSDGTKYEYYGYSYAGFEGASSAGAIVGTMDKDFNVVSNNSIATAPPISMNLIDDGAGNTFVYGNLNANKTFANEPTLATNSIAGQGWADKNNVSLYGANNNVYFGSMLKITDYAPAINVGDDITVNIDELTSQSSIDNRLLENIEVYDTFDFSEKNPANIGVDAESVKQRLATRINRNPNDLEADIEWKTLGLDNTKPGYNLVKFFVSDSNNQVSANSKVVNVISSQTAIEDNLSIDANNFYINLADVGSLDNDDVILRSNATAWNMENGTSLDVVANSEQLKAIINSKSEGVFKLELTAKDGSKVVKKGITIFVGGIANIDETIVLYANSFKVHLDNAASYTSSSAITDSNAKAYDVVTGKVINVGFAVDVSNINNATQIGPVSINVNFTNGEYELIKPVIASIYDKTVVFGDKDAIAAKSIAFNVSEIQNISSTNLRKEIQNRSAVKAWNLSTGKEEKFSFNESVVKAKVGEYNLTFTTDKKTKKDIKVFVFDQAICNGSGCTSSNATEVITASSFSLLPSQVDGLTNDTVISFASAKAIDLTTNESVPITTDYSGIRHEFGSYNVVFSTAKNTTIGVYANVGDNLVVEEEYAIAASDTFFTMDEVIEFESSKEFDDEILKRSGAKAWVVGTNASLGPVSIDASSTNFTEIDKSGYDVEYSYVSDEVTINRTDRVSLDDEEEKKDAIAAKDFTITASEVESLNNETVIEYAEAKSWLVSNNENIGIVSVDYSNVKAKQGIYDIVFTNGNDTSITVQVFVGSKNRPVINNDENLVFFANDYEIEENDVKNITSVDHIKAAEVLVVNKDTYEEIEIDYVDTKSIDSKSGTYMGSFGTNQDDMTSVTVTVVSDDLNAVSFAIGKLMLGLLLIGLVVVIRLVYTKEKRV